MLRMNFDGLYSPETINIVEENINKMIKEYMLSLLDYVCFGANNIYKKEYQNKLAEYLLILNYVPSWMTKEESFETFKGLYCLVNSDAKNLLPTIRMEYLLANIVEKVSDNDDRAVSFCEDWSFPKDVHDKIYEEAKTTIMTECRLDGSYNDIIIEKRIEAGMSEEDAEKNLENASDEELYDVCKKEIDNTVYMTEHFCYEMFDYLFDDCDYEFLDKMSDTELRNLPINDELGIVNKDEHYGDYTVSDDWLTAKDFRFVVEDRNSFNGK